MDPHAINEGSSFERQPLLNPQRLAYDPNYGGIVGFSESMRLGAGAANVDSDGSDLVLSVSEFDDSDYQEIPPSMTQREPPDGEHQQDSASPGGDPAPEPVGHPLNRPLVPVGEEEEEEDEEMVCKCCTSWYDWCLFLSCKLTVLVSPLRMSLRERKCLRRARTEGWRLLWSLILPLAVGSVPLQLVWVIAQLIASLALFGLSSSLISSGSWSGLVCCIVSMVWMLVTLVDTIVCLVAIQFYYNQFVWKISPYITVLRIVYSVICLHIVVFGNSASAAFNFIPGNDTIYNISNPNCLVNWSSTMSKVQFGLSVSSLCVFCDLTLLVVAVQFTRMSLRLHNAYSEAQSQPTKTIIPIHVAFELVLHLLMIFCAIQQTLYIPITVTSNSVECGNMSCCDYVSKKLLNSAGVFIGLSIIVPLFGLLSLYFIDYFWLQKYLASICLSVQSILQDRDTAARLRIPVNICERLQERSPEVNCELLSQSLQSFRGKTTFRYSLAHLCESPFSFIYSHFLFLLLPIMISVVIFIPIIFYIDRSDNMFNFVFGLPVTIIFIVFLVLHFRVVFFVILIVMVSPGLIVCFLPIVLLQWLLCCRQNCTHCCRVDLVP